MTKNDWITLKTAAIGAGTALTAWLGMLAAPVYLLVLLNLVDYATGVVAAPYRGEERSSYRGLRGIAKKVCMWLLVGVGAAVDWLLAFAVEAFGVSSPFGCVVACCAAVWLICNEILSILENISDIGVELPPFLKPAVEWVRERAHSQGEVPHAENY